MIQVYRSDFFFNQSFYGLQILNFKIEFRFLCACSCSCENKSAFTELNWIESKLIDDTKKGIRAHYGFLYLNISSILSLRVSKYLDVYVYVYQEDENK